MKSDEEIRALAGHPDAISTIYADGFLAGYKAREFDRPGNVFVGSKFTSFTNGIMLGCVTPEARNLMDEIEKEWEKHEVELKKLKPDYVSPDVYGFTYWLVRWSGLIQPAEKVHE